MELSVPARLTPTAIARLRAALATPSRVLVLRGHCAGLDVEALVAADFAAPLQAFAELLDALAADDRPVLYLLDGPARGGGVALVASADVVIARPEASVGLPEVFYGLVPSTVLQPLVRRVGLAQARRLALGTPAWSAEEALRHGLVDQIAPDLDAAAAACIERWSKADPAAVAALRRLTRSLPDPAQALAENATLLASPETRRRLAAVADGHAPWLGDEP